MRKLLYIAALALTDTAVMAETQTQQDTIEWVSKMLELKEVVVRGDLPNTRLKGNAMITNPGMRPDEITLYGKLLNDSTMQNIRTVSVSWCAYSTIIQLRSWLPNEVGGVAWICLDNPGESPRFPVFAGNTTLPTMLDICGQHRLRDDAALWHYRQANRLATVRWANYRGEIESGQQYFLDKGKRELPFVEQTWQSLSDDKEKQTFLDGYTHDFFGATITRWDDLYRKFTRQLWVGF